MDGPCYSRSYLRSNLWSWWLRSSSSFMQGYLKAIVPHYICWNIWKEYAHVTFGMEQTQQYRLEERIRMDIYSWCASIYGKKIAYLVPSLVALGLSPTIRSRRHILVRWHTPPPGRLKLNVDAAAGQRSAAAGAIVRDSTGRFVKTIAFALPRLSPLRAEIQALLYSLIYFSQQHAGFIIETDCLIIQSLLASQGTTGDMHIDLNRLCLFLQITRSDLQYTPRETNAAAHHLAAYAMQHINLHVFSSSTQLPPVC